jgi:hypothetical protein
MRRALLALPALLALALAGCPDPSTEKDISIWSSSYAPPSRVGKVTSTDEERSIQISRGLALAIGCWDTCDYGCVSPTFTAANPELLTVRPVYSSYGSSYVILAKAAGTTTLTISDSCASVDYAVTVEEP